MRLLVVQYAGDYLEAFRNLCEHNVETYHAHRYVIESMTGLGREIGEAALMCCRTTERYDVVLPTRLRVIGAAADPYRETDKVVEVISGYAPTHIVVHAPMSGLLKWCVRRNIKTLALFADSFPASGVKQRLRNHMLARTLNDRRIDWVANHNLNACLSTKEIGVRPDKIIPWDWPHADTPHEYAPKSAPSANGPLLAYVGLVSEPKGVGDIVHALADLKRRGVLVRAKIAGDGAIDRFRSLAIDMGVGDQLEFLGRVAHKTVIPLLREADIVVVPSHHGYPEGLPLTIYEALCSRTPLVASDHPMFRSKLADRVSALIYPAGRPVALADRIQDLLADHQLYARLSAASSKAWEGLQIPVKWGELITRWVRDSAADRDWLHQHRLTSVIYDVSAHSACPMTPR
jgi:glycosyltransferase involved in cell wall biosynthesis